MKFRINRKTWLCGDQEYSCLLRSDGLKCCLGFRALKSGFKAREVMRIRVPEHIEKNTERWGKLLKPDGANSAICDKIININDDPDLKREVREARLTKLFAKVGDEVEFYGEYPK